MELEELMLLKYSLLDYSMKLRHNTNCDTPKKERKRKKNDKCLNKLSTPYLISDESIELLREGVSWFFNIT